MATLIGTQWIKKHLQYYSKKIFSTRNLCTSWKCLHSHILAFSKWIQKYIQTWAPQFRLFQYCKSLNWAAHVSSFWKSEFKWPFLSWKVSFLSKSIYLVPLKTKKAYFGPKFILFVIWIRKSKDWFVHFCLENYCMYEYTFTCKNKLKNSIKILFL